MAIKNSLIILNSWTTPILILNKDNSRTYFRLFVEGEYAYLGGSNLTKENGIFICWKNVQEFRSPESKEAFYALGQCNLRVLEDS